MKYIVGVLRTTMGVRISVPLIQFERAILKFAEDNLHAPKMGKEQGRFVEERGDPYYAYLPALREFIFHRDYEAQILQIIHRTSVQFQIDYEVVYDRHPTATPYQCKFENYGFNLEVDDPESRFYYQNEVVARAIVPERFQVVFAIQTGRGKCSAHGTPVKVPGGWKRIEHIQVGDQVTGGDGKPTTVTGVYPQGMVDMYMVTLEDGRQTQVCGEHLWWCFYINTTPERRWGVRNTLEMKRLISMPNPRVYLPIPEPEDCPAADLLIDPYLLGVLIGDGNISTQYCINWTKPDEFIRDRIKAILPPGYKITTDRLRKQTHTISKPQGTVCPIMTGLKTYMLHGCRSWEKFIPSEYFYGSIEQRWELVRGLMDTDGTVNKDGGQPSYTTTSKQLALHFIELIRSLGGIAKMSSRVPTYTYKGEKLKGRQAYTVFLRHRQPSLLFSLPRKKELCRDNGQYNDILKLRVSSIEPIGRDLGTCISVDNEDKLFVVENWIVTHNTKTAQKVMVKGGVRTALIHRPAYVPKWQFDCCEDPTGLRESKDVVHTCKGVESIYDVYELGRSGELDRRGIKIVIIPTVTLQLFLKEWMNSAVSNPVKLEDFYNAIGVGEVVLDEVHEHFHLVYMSAVLMNPPRLLDMSATLKPGKAKQFIAERYIERFPIATRVSIPYIPVVDVRAIIYAIHNKKVSNYAGWMSPYNHKLVEMKMISEGLAESYFDMIYDVMSRSYLAGYQAGQKALVMFMTVDMCERFMAYLKVKLAATDHHYLQVVKYNAGDSYDDFIAADIGVSTPGKSGTAIDIPGLVHAYITPPINDEQQNEQIAGRPRELKNWDLTPKVWYFHCGGVPKQMSYLENRRESLKDIVKSFLISNSPYVVRSATNANTPNPGQSPAALRRAYSNYVSKRGTKGVSRRGRKRR